MLFNSAEFLFLFLPLVYIVFQILARYGQLKLLLLWLTLSSLFFYGWWNPSYLILILTSIGVNYTCGRLLSSDRSPHYRKNALLIGLVFNLGLLGYYKYANFFVGNINYLLADDINLQTIVLPLAISFFTFQQFTYLVDSYKGLTESHSFLEYCLFVTFFPQLIAGPIVHHKDMLVQFQTLHQQQEILKNLVLGCSIIAIGLFKKVVLADSFAQYATPFFQQAEEGQLFMTLDTLLATFSYTFQLYFDFSGYSDMAIGLACLFGLKLPVNFFSPFRARNISDFWRTWHATLARFLRDYVYAPLGGFLCSPNRQRFNLFMTMFAGGVWHGAGWTFFVYGILHGMYAVIHQLWRIKVSGPLGFVGNRFYDATSQLFTFLLVALTLIVFRAESIHSAIDIVGYLFNSGSFELSAQYMKILEASTALTFLQTLSHGMDIQLLIVLSLCAALIICWCLPNTYHLFRRYDVAILEQRIVREPVINIQWGPNLAWAVGLGTLLALALIGLGGESEFIYFQF